MCDDPRPASSFFTRSVLLVAAVLLLAPRVASGGERELWVLWKKHLGALERHAEMVNMCRKYAAAYPSDAFLPVVRGLEAWHLLSEEKTAEAARLLAPYLRDGQDALHGGAQRLARGWLTRLQREKVVEALQYYYRKEVRYPATLEALVSYPGLPEAGRLPLKDAWARPWRYRLAGFDAVPGFRDQKYLLESASTQPPWDAAEALALPYAEQIQVAPLRVADAGPGSVSVVRLEFLGGPNKGKTTMTQVGRTAEGLTVAYAGQGLVILCDTLHWQILTWKK